MENIRKQPGFERDFIQDQLSKMAKDAAHAGIPADVFEALVIALAEELDFEKIMSVSKEISQ
ncbi:hypothetical protein [Commensalibacter oyaizuii]|uniref:Uncharacterized protein n=1 Tax=Commensalibacter oyaizuii TaxID=3043873 RepID=A0ABT6Q2C2_9PROT|nr:hypothetical protein [Commensalibacter sp. TBRC 16381]MDI2091273.1 hypothetical protein [Commensalibacter sp. TBRC 16381]